MLRRRRAAAGLASALVILATMAAACVGGSPATPNSLGGPAGLVTPAPSLPGTPGHYDDGQFSFDYPTDWPVIAGTDNGREFVAYVLAVFGNGTWAENCQSGGDSSFGWSNCGTDVVTVPTGGEVVKVYLWYGGPAVPCRGDTQANATYGDLAVRETVEPGVTTWEIRAPGNEFGQPNNIFVEAHTDDPAQLAKAVGVMASFRWNMSTYPGGSCPTGEGESPSPVPSPGNS